MENNFMNIFSQLNRMNGPQQKNETNISNNYYPKEAYPNAQENNARTSQGQGYTTGNIFPLLLSLMGGGNNPTLSILTKMMSGGDVNDITNLFSQNKKSSPQQSDEQEYIVPDNDILL